MTAFKRDIRSDLKERIAHWHKVRDHHAAAVKDADAEINLLTRMLDAENARYHEVGNGQAPVKAPEPSLPIADFILAKVKTGAPISKDDLRIEALDAGYLRGSAYPGRSVHAVVVSLKQRGLVDLNGEMVLLPQKELAG